jgi:hypothetical protein
MSTGTSSGSLGAGPYDSNHSHMIVIAWSKLIFEYIETASEATNLALGGRFTFVTSALNDSLFSTHHGTTPTSAVLHLATTGRSLTGFLWTLAVARNCATFLQPWMVSLRLKNPLVVSGKLLPWIFRKLKKPYQRSSWVISFSCVMFS